MSKDTNLMDDIDDAIETAIAAHDSLDNDSRCSCGARNNMDGDVLHAHRVWAVSEAVSRVLFRFGLVDPADELSASRTKDWSPPMSTDAQSEIHVAVENAIRRAHLAKPTGTDLYERLADAAINALQPTPTERGENPETPTDKNGIMIADKERRYVTMSFCRCPWWKRTLSFCTHDYEIVELPEGFRITGIPSQLFRHPPDTR